MKLERSRGVADVCNVEASDTSLRGRARWPCRNMGFKGGSPRLIVGVETANWQWICCLCMRVSYDPQAGLSYMESYYKASGGPLPHWDRGAWNCTATALLM